MRTLPTIQRKPCTALEHSVTAAIAAFGLPEGFIPVECGLPAKDKPVLAIRLSGYWTAKFEILTAKYMPDFRPLNPWQTIAGDTVTDSGYDVAGWKNADGWLI